jgi:NADPH:quinone reductase-like Zn-dependent oxidoreductase
MKAVRFHRFGSPSEVLQVEHIAAPTPGPGEVRVRMIASPVNPSDLLVVRGEYGRLPSLPATPGFEGVGVVDATGGGLLGWLRRGRRVAVLNGRGGNWQEQVLVPARQVVPLPASIPDEQAASFFVNPATVVIIIRYLLKVPRGAWLLQTAAGSAVGRMIIRLSKADGFRTLNVVRRREQVEELLRLGADAVICTRDESIEERVPAITGGDGVRFAVDAVGGATGAAVASALGPDGRMLLYGTLSGEPLPVDPRVLMVGSKRIEGFWLSEWVRRQRPLPMLRLFRQIKHLMGTGILTTGVGASFPLDQIRQAVQRAEQPGRDGKVLLRIAGSESRL